MAKKKQLDIRESGPQTYRQLQNANNDPFVNIRPGVISPTSIDVTKTQDVLSPLANTNTPWGQSIWDEGTANAAEFANLGDVRAGNQPWYAQLGAGLAKGVILAATTFLNGTLGLLYGGIKAIDEEDPSKIWDNDFSHLMQDINQASEEFIPNYYSQDELNSPWYKNILTTNWLGDKLIKNIGFTVGAIYGGGLISKGVKGIGRLVMGGAKNLGATVSTLKGISKGTSIAAAGVGAVTSAVSEGSIEAINGSEDFVKGWLPRLNEDHEMRLALIQREFELGGDEVGYMQAIEAENKRYTQVLDKLEQDRVKVGNVITAANTALLTANNLNMFGRLFANGFRTSKMGLSIVGGPGSYKAESTKLGAAWNTIKNPISEGTEEVTQSVISAVPSNYYSTDVSNFYKAQMNPQAEQETLDWAKALSQSLVEVLGDQGTWEEFTLGAITGAMGVPMIRSSRSSDGKLQSPIYLEGGAYNELRAYNQKRSEEQRLAEYMNNRLASPEFLNYYRGLIRHNKYQKDMNQAVEQGDEFEFKNAEHAQLVSDIVMFDKAGKLEDLKTAINEAAGTTEEDIRSIVENTTSKTEDGKLVGPFAKYAQIDENGNIVANLNNPESVEEIRSKINQNKKDILDTIKNYQDIKDDLILGTNGKLSDEQVEELTWMKSQLKNWSDRATAMSGDIKEAASKILGTLDVYLRIAQQIRDHEGASSSGLTELYKKADQNVGNLQKTIESLRSLGDFDNSELGIALATNSKYTNSLIKLIEDIDEDTISSEQKQEIITKLKDILRLGDAANRYKSKLKEYLETPQRQEDDHAEADKQVAKETKENNIDSKSTSEIVHEAESGDIDIYDSEFDFDEEDRSYLSGETETLSPELERKQKVNNARGIISTKRAAKRKASQSAANDTQKEDINNLINKAAEIAESPEDVLDLDTEVFNDPNNLLTTEEEQQLLQIAQDQNSSQEEINEAVEAYNRSRQKRLDEIKAILEQVKEATEEDFKELERIPIGEGKVVRVWGETKSKDPTEAPETVNKETQNYSKETEEPPTPDTSNINLDPVQNGVETTNDTQKGYWKTHTTEYPIHRETSNNDPYYKRVEDPKQRDIYKTIYEFLENSGTFTRIKNNEIKPGKRVRFAISKKLTSDLMKKGEKYTVLLVVDDNGNVIADLTSPYDSTFEKYPEFIKFYNEAIIYYNDNEDKVDRDLVIIPNIESTIGRPYVGRPLYEVNNERHTLNEISEGKPFKLALALTSAPSPHMIMTAGRRKSQGLSAEDQSIMKPLSAKAGQPYLLIETSDPNRKWYPVPITMPTFNSETQGNTKLNKIILEHISKLSNPEDLGTEEKQINWANKLKDLLSVDDIFLEIVPSVDLSTKQKEYFITFRVKKLKTDTAWTTIYKGTSINTADVLKTLDSLNISYKISRKYINSTFEGQNYNSLIGELASTNVVIGALHTVNDFYSINPIIDGKQKKADIIEDSNEAARDAVDRANANRETSFVRNTILPSQDNVNREKTDKDYYYIKEEDGKYHRYSRVHKVLPQNSNNDGSNPNSQRALRTGSAIDKIVRDFFNTGKPTKPDFMSEAAYNSVLGYLKSLDKWLKDHKWTVYANNIVLYNKYPDGRRIAGEVDLLLVDDKGNYHIYDIKTSAGLFEGDYFEGVHPNWGQVMSTKDYYSAQVSSYAKLLNDRFGKKTASIAIIPFNIVYGENDNVTGVNRVPNVALPIVDVESYFKRAALESPKDSEAVPSTQAPESKSNTSESKTNVSAARENLSNNRLLKSQKWQNRLSRLNDENILGLNEMARRNPILKRTLDFLDAKIKDSMSDEELNNLVAAQLKPKNREAAYSPLTSEEQSILSSAPRDAQGRLLAPNGKPSNLTERQYVQVRTKAFKDWFGDWENDPKNASKIVDENGEPLVVYHGSGAIFTTFKAQPDNNRQKLSTTISPKFFFTDSERTARGFVSVRDEALLRLIDRELNNIPLEEVEDEDKEVWGYIAKRAKNATAQELKDLWYSHVKAGDIHTYKNPDRERYFYSVFINAKNPIIIDVKGKRADEVLKANKDVIDSHKEVIIKNINETKEEAPVTCYLVTDSIQIKSATENIGTFSTTNEDIRYRKFTGESESLIDRELNVMEKLLPQLSQEDRVRIVDSLIKIPNGEAWGQFKDGAITLYRSAARGTAYHEAFHFVFNSLMTDTEIEDAFESAEKQWGNLSPIELEERMAEDFRRYMQNEETFIGRLKNLWSKFKALLNHLNKNWNYLDRIYADIAKGKYSSRTVIGGQTIRNRGVFTVSQMQEIVDSNVNNSYLNKTRVAKNKAWGQLADAWEEQGYKLKGYYDPRYYGYRVTSIEPISNAKYREIEQYHNDRLSYGNLDQDSKKYLSMRKITPQEYNQMTVQEKEILFTCRY